MDLNSLWFVLIAVLLGGFLFLEGFDYGVAVLLPFVGKNDIERRVLINSIGPFWDGNEVWMIVAVGAMFAAFPSWYATLLSGFYMIFFIILVALIIRGVAFEFRSKLESSKWKGAWDAALTIGSLVPAFLWGVVLTNLIAGVPIDAEMNFVGGMGDIFSPVALLGGITGLLVFVFHGAVFINLKVEGNILEKARKAALYLGIAAAAAVVAVLAYALTKGKILENGVAVLTALIALVALITAYLLVKIRRYKAALLVNGLVILAGIAAVFSSAYPRVMVSSISDEFSLTIINAASGSYTLKIVTIAAATLLPVVIGSQIWSYWVFRKRINQKELEY